VPGVMLEARSIVPPGDWGSNITWAYTDRQTYKYTDMQTYRD